MMYCNILSNLPASHPWRENIHCYNSIDSTNTAAKALAASGAPEGTVLLADTQTGGRGRMGRSFYSPAGCGVYMSVVLRPRCPVHKLMHLTCAVAVAAADAIEQSVGFRPGIKWTNDLTAGKQKLGGILTELSLDANGNVDYAVLGIGINCCQTHGDFPSEIRDIATSLQIFTGKAVDRSAVAAALLVSLMHMNDTLMCADDFLNRYRADCITLGQPISVVRAEDVRRGTALDIDNHGALIVQFDDGHTETVQSGEVSIRGMYGYT